MDKPGKIGLHLAFWFFFSIIPRLLSPPAFNVELFFFVTLVIDIVNFYVFYFFIIPKYFAGESKGPAMAISFVIIVLIILLRLTFSNQILKSNEVVYKLLTRNPPLFVLREVISTLLFVVYPLLLTFTVRYFALQKARMELMAQKKESELSLLRSQINPHFFFNTLNNIYALVYAGSPDAHKAVMKLSELMRYNLYKSNSDKVLLEAEISYLKTFIELELLRIKDKAFVKLETAGDFNGWHIAPMILVPFVENAFKHCNKNVAAPGIRIRINLNENVLLFSVRNHTEKVKAAGEQHEGGIGLANVKKRLALLYPERHMLTIEDKDEGFFAELILQLG